MIIRQQEPANLETPFELIDSFLTPAELFYIRSHFPEPQLDLSSYKLSIGGAVANPLLLSYEELKAFPAETRTATLECAGNSRVFLVPPAEGAQWGLGAVGNAEWTGVPLKVLLERAQITDDVCEIILEGADAGTPKEKPIPPGQVSYARSLSRHKALLGNVLIAYQMNGHELPRSHGFPVRAIVPGHYGMASVKWLTQIQAVTKPFQGYWQTSDYAYWDYLNGKPIRKPLGEIAIKSEISRPGVHATIAANEPYLVCGAAWSGETTVREISVSVDAGQTWNEGNFIDSAERYAWRRWQFEWLTPKVPGPYTVMARATDESGATQPEQHDSSFGSYVINHWLPIKVFVR